MSGQWEVVKKKGHRGDNTKKNQKTKNAENMPKAQESVPIKESQTMFDAFIEQEKKRQQQLQQENNSKVNNVPKSKESNTQSKKKSSDKKKTQAHSKVPSLEEGIASIKYEDMATHFATVEARFPNAQQIWLQDLASYLNVKLDVELPDPCFVNKPIGYPKSLLSEQIESLYSDIISRCSESVIQHSYETCLHSMINDTLKGINTIGYRIFLQFIAQHKPEVILETLPKYIDFLSTYQNRRNVCFSLLWAAMQAGYADLKIGLKVWVEIFLPMLATKAFSKYILDQLQGILSYHGIAKPDKSYLEFRDLFPILDALYSLTLPVPLTKQFLSIYPSLKELSYGPEPSAILRNYFPSYLRRLETNSSPALKAEVLSSLLECLTVDQMNFSIWRQLYTKHLMQSSILVSHLNNEWPALPRTFPKKLLAETVSAFQVTNDELMSKGKVSPDVESSITFCNEVLNKMNAQRFPWLKVLFFAAVLITSLLAYDVKQSGSFKSSKTGQFMKDAGLLAICEQAWGKISVYGSKSYKWLETNFPVFKSWSQKTLVPYIESFWNYVFAFLLNIWNSTECIRNWVNVNIPPILQMVSDNVPVYLKSLSQYMESFMVYVSKFSIAAYKTAESYSTATIAWLHKNVLTGSLSTQNLQKYAGNTVQAFQEYTLTTYNWITNYVAAVIYPGK